MKHLLYASLLIFAAVSLADTVIEFHPTGRRPAPLPAFQPAIEFLSGGAAEARMNAIGNAAFSWRQLNNCGPSGQAGGIPWSLCPTNQTVLRPGGTLRVSNPPGLLYQNGSGQLYGDGVLLVGNDITISFSPPVSAVGLLITEGYRTWWTTGLEAFDASGISLGKVEESGQWNGLAPPAVYNAVIASAAVISSIRVYATKLSGGLCGFCLNPTGSVLLGSLEIQEAAPVNHASLGRAAPVLLD